LVCFANVANGRKGPSPSARTVIGALANQVEKHPALQKVKGAMTDVVKSIDLLKVAKKGPTN
jgi:hypothetical protein